jgi:hypothetical protein
MVKFIFILASASITMNPIFGSIKSSLRIESLKIDNFSPNKNDITGGLIVP